MRKPKDVAEFGDFQTPDSLALSVTRRLFELGAAPRCVIEPTCGSGSFLAAAAEVFPTVECFVGREINPRYLEQAQAKLNATVDAGRLNLRVGDFFKMDWMAELSDCPGPWLILGNPPWVTSSELGSLESANLPEKSNFQQRVGMDALTGKSNFDISEWMLIEHVKWLNRHPGTLGMLCKTAVARKILLHTWKNGYPLQRARIYRIDAMRYFGAAVDACLFILEAAPGGRAVDCDVYDSLDAVSPAHTIGLHHGLLINDVAAFTRREDLFGPEELYTWRSGIKHDCSKVMELARAGEGIYCNGFGQAVDLEETFLFPMFKSSDIANARLARRNMMLVTQRSVGEDTNAIETVAPRTWRYLQQHAEILNKRGSSIYRNRPPFSIFGVGPYSFTPWKVAVSGFYKDVHFTSIGPLHGRPVVFDDTIYFLPCGSEAEAQFLAELLNSAPAREFYDSMIYRADKRPVTVDLLRRLNIAELARQLDRAGEYLSHAAGSVSWRRPRGAGAQSTKRKPSTP